MPPAALLPLNLQNTYRERYRAMRPGWQTSGSQLEAIVRGYARAGSSVLDLGCGRGGGGETIWGDVKLGGGRDPGAPAFAGGRAPGVARPRGGRERPALRGRTVLPCCSVCGV